MKTIEQVREEYDECPKGHGREHLIFQGETVHCKKCQVGKQDYDLGMKKYK
ncbi:hypothetical protein HQ533_03645 [Candidatus Woesearchaeota archaeon]|nr:hypothetical protein [Candidatus Woesearchaeota archaeon]